LQRKATTAPGRWHLRLSKQMSLQPPLKRVQWQVVVTVCATVLHCIV